jgi:cytosine/adenosine deaminase-related metal-dependent hydrolase
MFGWARPITFVNARILTVAGEASSIRFRRVVLSIGDGPQAGDHVVDLQGRYVLPGLINAHDHLELNHYGPLKCRDRYDNAREWIADLRPVIKGDARIRSLSRFPLADRLFIGGLKNLLAGATFVAHHNPIYAEFGAAFPVRLLRRFGWAHSIAMQDGPVGARGERGGAVGERAAATRRDRPFIVHAAEGVDEGAASEIDDLDAVGALKANAVLVHGVGVPTERWPSLFARGVGLVWCPGSNLFLFGRTLCMSGVLRHADTSTRVCLGSDSRLTGAGDLLAELRIAQSCGVEADALLTMVTSAAADVLRVKDAGRLALGMPADLTVIPAIQSSAAEALLKCSRSDLALVVRGGQPVHGNVDLQSVFTAARVASRPIEIDGVLKLMEAGLVRRIERCPIAEPGVRCVDSW